MESLDVLPQPRAGLLFEHRRGILAKHAIGELTESRGRTRTGRAEVRNPRDAQPGRHQTGLELGEGRGLEPALTAQLFHERLHRVDPGRLHLDLDTGQAKPPPLMADRYDGVVQRELGNRFAVDLQVEGVPPRPNLQHLFERACSHERLDSPADLAGAVEAGEARGRQTVGSPRAGDVAPLSRSRGS